MAGQARVDRSLVPDVEQRARTAAAAPPSQLGPLLRRIGFFAILASVTVLFIYPLIWLVSASLKPGNAVFNGEIIPNPVMWENYSRLFRLSQMADWARNSAIVSLLAAVTVTFSSALVAFCFAYFRFRGRDLLFGLVLGSLMLPGTVTLIPTYLIWQWIGQHIFPACECLGVNSLTPLWAGNLFASPFYIFLLRQFFLGLPRELFDAARVDGANYLRMWWSIALPLTRAALIVVFVFEVKAAWTDLVKPLIFLRDIELFTLPRGLKAILDNPSIGGERHFELLAVGGVIVTVPMIIIFFLAQRYFIEGIATTGSTGR
jgi:multiple sugar transport system permease protein